MKRPAHFGSLVLKVMTIAGLLLALASPVMAKGNFTGVVLSGGDLAAPVDIGDPALHTFFAFFDQRIATPAVQGDGYLITRDGWDQLLYYPDPSGSGGYVRYVGLINGRSEYDGHWYTVPPNADRALRQAIAARRASLQILPFYLVGALILLALGAWLVERRAVPGGVQSQIVSS